MDNGGGGSIKIFRRKIFLSQCRIFRRATLLCSVSEIFPVAKKFMDKREGEGVSRYSVHKNFSHSAKKSAGESFTVPLLSGIE